jgi:hypothetical protein
MLGINSGHHNLPTYEISLKSNNVEFLRYCGGHFENGDWVHLHMQCKVVNLIPAHTYIYICNVYIIDTTLFENICQ